MCRDVRTVLESHTTEFTIERTLHDIPPHRVYEIEYEGQRAVCKLSEGVRTAAAIEGHVLQYVDQETTLPVPEVLAVGADHFITAYRTDVLEQLNGETNRLTEEWLRVAGRTLARLHTETEFDRPGLLAVDGDPAEPDTRLCVGTDGTDGESWSDALDALFGVYQRTIEGTGYEDVVANARTFLATYADYFDTPNSDAVLLHGWFTSEHVAVDEGEVTCLIDFEHALAGNGEWDYWRAAMPLFYGSGWERPRNAEELFRTEYESVRPLPSGFDSRTEAYRAFVTVSYLDSLHTQRGIDAETREQAEFFRRFVSEALDELRAEWG